MTLEISNKLLGGFSIKIVMIDGCEVYFDPKNMTEEQAVEQFQRAKENAGNGSSFKKFTASRPHKGEPWVEQLAYLKRKMKREQEAEA